MTNNLSFETPENRYKYARLLRGEFEKNNLNYWWVSPSVKTNEILITPRDFGEWQKEAYPPISRISIQINPEGKPNFGVSGYNFARISCENPEFQSRGYNCHQHIKKSGVKGRWWLIKKLNSIEEIVTEFKDIEHLLRKK